MSFGVTGIGDLSNNKYAAAMKELANGLAGWSGFWVYPNLSNELVSRITTFIRKLLVSPLGEWKIKIDRIPF